MSKRPSEMAASAINAELDKLDKESSAITHALIDAGRGSEKPSERKGKTDALSVRYQKEVDRRNELRQEIITRYGKEIQRLPSGRAYGPRTHILHR